MEETEREVEEKRSHRLFFFPAVQGILRALVSVLNEHNS